MPFDRPTLTEISNRIKNDIKNRIEASDTFLRRSVLLILGDVISAADHLIYGYLQYQKDQMFALTADAENLDNHGKEYGISRKYGGYAAGSGSISGTVGTVADAGSRLQSASGNVYTIDTSVTIGAGGTASIDFTAEEVGDEYNESGGATLTFISPISGINSDITVDSSGITGGTDEESDEDYRARVLARKRKPPHGGAIFDYEKWALEVDGVTRAWAFSQYQGPGTIGLAFVRDDDTDLIPNETQREAVKTYVTSHTDPITGLEVGIPVTAEPGFFIIPLNKYAINFNIKIYPNTTAIQDSIESRLQDLINSNGGPGETVALSQMYEAISSAVGEIRNKIISPTDDVTAAINQVHVLGDITFQDY